MQKIYVILMLCTVLSASWLCAWGAPAESVKILPYSVDYPLIRPTLYSSPRAEPYEQAFGVRRWPNPIETLQSADFQNTLKESYEWHQKYGGYGVLGHGEDVFTNKAAAFRRLHRGR